MRIKEFLTEDKVYTKVEDEIRQWIERTYKGLSIEFYDNTMEIVRTDKDIDFSKEDVLKITEVVNIKIGDIMTEHAEELFIAGKLEKIWKKHPEFNIEVSSIEELKRNKKFLKYFASLTIKPGKKGRRIARERLKEKTREVING